MQQIKFQCPNHQTHYLQFYIFKFQTLKLGYYLVIGVRSLVIFPVCLKPPSSNLEPLSYHCLLNLGIDLPTGEAPELRTR
jgi:hypothetical protein